MTESPLTDEQTRIQLTVNALTEQRNQALNALASANAEIAMLQTKLAAATRPAVETPADSPQE